MSKLGVHISGSRRSGFGAALRACADTNQPMASVKSLGEFGALAEAKAVDSRTVTIGQIPRLDGAINFDSSPQEQAAVWYAEARPTWMQNHAYVDYWEVLNEIDSHYEWQADFYIEMARLAALDNFKICVFNSSTGTPFMPSDDGGATYRAVARACRSVREHGAILGLHEYGIFSGGTLRGSAPYHALRYRFLAEFLMQNDALLPIAITECAPDSLEAMGGNIMAFMDELGWYDTELMKDGHVIACNIFTLDGGTWHGWNYQEAFPELANWIIAHPTPALPPPPPPPPPPPAPRTWNKLAYLAPQNTTLAEYDLLQEVAYPTRSEITFSFDSAFSRAANVIGHRVIVYDVDRQGGQIALESLVNLHYAYATAPTLIEYRTFGVPLPPPPPPPPPPPQRVGVGLEMRADGNSRPADFAAFDAARVEWAKLKSNGSFEELDALLARVPPDRIIFRMFADMRDPAMTSGNFFAVHQSWLACLRDKMVRYVEIHNEPNLPAEGLGDKWLNAEGFVAYYSNVAHRIRSEFPSLLLGYPGLSPQPNVVEWLPTIPPLIRAGLVDWIGAHSYWQFAEQMTHPEHGYYWQRFADLGRPTIITEFANVDLSTPKAVKGQQYVDYWRALSGLSERRPLAAISFVVSASDPAFAHEVWVDERGAPSDIPGIVGARS